jgi:dynein heavy chain
MKARYVIIGGGGKEIHKILKSMNKKLNISPGLPDWKSYCDFINNVIISGLAQVVESSLTYLNEQLDADIILKDDKLPILEIELELYGKDVMFVPDVGPGPQDKKLAGIRSIIGGWIEGFLGVTRLFKRFDSTAGTFGKELLDNPFLQW